MIFCGHLKNIIKRALEYHELESFHHFVDVLTHTTALALLELLDEILTCGRCIQYGPKNGHTYMNVEKVM